MKKNLNPLNWTKKQQIVGGVVAIALVGGITSGVVVNANHEAEVKKIERLEKEKVEKAKQEAEQAKKLEKESEANSKKLLDIAEKTPNAKNIKGAEDSLLKIKNAEVKKAFETQVTGIKIRVKLENTAKTAVSNYQKDAMNQGKYKTAQQAVSKLTSSYSKGLKDSLTKKLTASKKQADEATKAQKAKSASEAKTANTQKNKSVSVKDGTGNSSNVGDTSQARVDNTAPANSSATTGGNQNSYAQAGANTSSTYNNANTAQNTSPTPNNSNSNTQSNTAPNTNQGNSGQSNSNSNANAGGNNSSSNNTNTGGTGNSTQPTHVTKYLGWVSVDGVRKYTKLCDTVAEAWSFVDSTKNSSEVINLGFDGHSISYGTDTVEV